MSLILRVFSLVKALRPPRNWHLGVIILLGIFGGLTALTFHVSRASSYLGDDPATCVNCHVMEPQYATWATSSHARVATCNDCHVPHDSVIKKYGFKAYDGSRHAFMYTFRMEPQVIRIHAPGASVVQDNCVRCHGDLVGETSSILASASHGSGQACWDCHQEVPHGRVNSLSSVPDGDRPRLAPLNVPVWLTDQLNESPQP